MITKRELNVMALVANDLDDLSMYKEANLITDKIIKIAQDNNVTDEHTIDMKKLTEDAYMMDKIMHEEILGVLDFVELRIEYMKNLEQKYITHLKDNPFNKNYSVGYESMLQKIKQLKMFFEKRAEEYEVFIDEARTNMALEEEKKRLQEVSEKSKQKSQQEREELRTHRIKSRWE